MENHIFFVSLNYPLAYPIILFFLYQLLSSVYCNNLQILIIMLFHQAKILDTPSQFLNFRNCCLHDYHFQLSYSMKNSHDKSLLNKETFYLNDFNLQYHNSLSHQQISNSHLKNLANMSFFENMHCYPSTNQRILYSVFLYQNLPF